MTKAVSANDRLKNNRERFEHELKMWDFTKSTATWAVLFVVYLCIAAITESMLSMMNCCALRLYKTTV